jgi:glucan phosphoethanolaminetransferase (alkaline phosphatase superfamily)
LLLAAYVVLNFLPNLVLLYLDGGAIPFVRGILVSGLLFAAVFALFRRHLWIACLVFLPFAVLAPAEAYYILRYDRPSDANIIATIFESNLREASEFLGPARLYLALSMLCAGALGVWTTLAIRASGRAWRHRSALWVLCIVLGVPLFSVAVTVVRPAGDGATRNDRVSATLERLRLETFATYPFGVPDRFLDYRREWGAMREAAQTQASFRFDAARRTADGARQIYVLVIGEASRRDHWSIFGYDRPTNPELGNIANVVPITDMVTSWPMSRWAVPMIVTRKPADDTESYFREPSVARVFAEAGFQTYWYSTQSAVGPFDSPISIAAFDAATVKFFNPAGFTAGDVHDDALLAPLHDAIASSNRDLFIVLHTMGSHEQYSLRYPREFDHFKAPVGASTLAAELTDTYDNTILFTDHVLAAVITELQQAAATTALFYVSDHGETLPHGTCVKFGHAVPALHVYTVASLFWYSDAYAARYPAKVESIRANAGRALTTGNVFESLVDMADLDFPSHDASRSVFSPTLASSLRMIHGNELVDFDNMRVVSDCEFVAPAANPRPSREAVPSASPN